MTWATTSIPNGSHTLTAQARDLTGNLTTSSPVTVTVANTTPAPGGLVAAYGFNEGTGASAGDASGRGHTGALSGATWTTSGRFGGALTFDGVNDWVTVADTAALDLTTGATIEAWVRPTTTSAWQTVALKERPNGLAYALYSRADVPGPAGYGNVSGDVGATGPAALALNAWSHLALTYDGGVFRLFVNGTQVATRALSGSLTTSSSPLRLGGNQVWGEYFAGTIDEVRVYNRALAPSEIQADMSAAIGGAADSTPPTVSIDTPAANATVSGTVAIGASASDNVGVAGVQFLIDGSPLGAEDTSAPYSVSWSTAATANGPHTLGARARDSAGNLSDATSIPVTVGNTDTTAPTVALTAPAAGATVSAVVTVSATASDAVGVSGVQFLLDGNPLGTEDTAAPYSVSWTTTSASNGSHTVSARARDAAGNLGTATPVSVTVNNADTTAPTVAVTAPAAGATVSGVVTVSATASDVVGVSGVQFLLDGNPLGTEDTAAPYSVSWTTTSASNGSHTVSARARDAAGNFGTATPVSVTVNNADTTAPTVGLTAPAPGTTVSGVVTVSATASDAVGVSGVQFLLDGNPLGAEDTAAPFSVAWATTGTSNGAHAVSARARDAAGNLGTATPVSVTVNNADTTAPTVAIAAPASGATVSGVVTVSANASDAVGVSGVQFLLDGNPLGAEDTAAPYSVAWSTTGTSNGAHAVSARARDAAGNLGTATPVSVTVNNADTTAPTVAITAPAAGATVAGVVPVSATATDAVGVAGVQFLLDGNPLGAEDTTAPYSVSWTTSSSADGSHTLGARARDAAGNLGTASSVAVSVANGTPSPSGLVAAYAFAEGMGTTTADGSGRGHVGTLSGATWTAAGRSGNALTFDGVNDWVTIADTAALDLTTGLTIEAWVNPTSTGTWRTIVLKERPSGLAYGLYSRDENGRPAGYARISTDVGVSGASVLPANTWSHLAVTYNGATFVLYVNGVQAGTDR